MTIAQISHSEKKLKHIGKRLHKAASMVNHSHNCFQAVPSYKTPSLKQFYEIVAKGYGYNTYAGFVDDQKNNDQQLFIDEVKLKDGFKHLMNKVNFNRISLFDFESFKYKKENFFSGFDGIFYLSEVISLSKLTRNLNISKQNYLSYLNVDYGQEINSSYLEHYEIIVRNILNLIIEKMDHVQVFPIQDHSPMVMLALPISVVYPYEVNDIREAESILHELSEILRSRYTDAHMGGLDFMQFKNSVVNLRINKTLYLDLIKASKVVKLEKQWSEDFNGWIKRTKRIDGFKTADLLKNDEILRYYLMQFICMNKHNVLGQPDSHYMQMQNKISVNDALSTLERFYASKEGFDIDKRIEGNLNKIMQMNKELRGQISQNFGWSESIISEYKKALDLMRKRVE
jgi:hypothetical protein